MKAGDLDTVVRIEAGIFSMPWSKDNFASALEVGGSNYLVAELSGVVVGYCGYYSFLEEAEITNVAMLQEYRGNGYAKKMLQELLRRARANYITKVVLEVRYSNESAIALYEKLGFQKIGVRKDFYEQPREDAIIMMLEME